VTEDLETILARVASGELSPEEAEPLVAAAAPAGEPPAASAPEARPLAAPAGPARRAVRLVVMEHGRQVVNLRIPLSIASLAGAVVPGLSTAQSERLRDALRSGEVGPILEIRDEDGGGVVISTE
jgi:hypothetical protein